MASKSDVPEYDLLVLGGGSGGIATARRAASYGAKVALFEENRYGGTCVNVGCVPKKLMWQASTISHILHGQAKFYGFETGKVTFDLKGLKERRDDYVKFLNGIYKKNLDNDKITHVEAHAKFVDKNIVEADGKQYKGKKILIAVGGFPYKPKDGFPGLKYINTSDDFFNKLDKLPKKCCIVGAGYIAVELAQVLALLGSNVSLFIRGEHPLRKFDEIVEKGVHNGLRKSGVNIITNSVVTGIYDDDKKSQDNELCLTVKTEQYKATGKDGKKNTNEYTGFDYILYAIGRGPLSSELGLDKTEIKQDKRGFIISNEFEETNQKNVYALGDINDKMALTPVAIRAGRFLADRLFNNSKQIMKYEFVPSVIFSHPPVGTIGYTEQEVTDMVKNNKLDEPITIYETHFRNLQYGVIRSTDKDEDKKNKENDELAKKYKIKTHMKLICVGKNEKIVGLHMMGEGCDEMLQGFGVAMKMGATKDDFDSVCAIHPTGAEELVTLKKPRSNKHTYEFENWDDEQKKDE